MSQVSRRKSFITLIVCACFALFLASPSIGEEKKVATTTVTVGEMCGGCVKRITAHFEKVEDVSKIKCDIEAKTVMLFPAKDVQLSPLKVWEMMEGIGKKPVKLIGPEGTFTSKPKQS
ncbi:MAG: heavy-metal-associated domain-containing protein [Planctomycetota bacterium]